MIAILVILAALLGIAIVAAAIVAGIYNRLVALRNRFKNAFAQIDVQLKRRYDLIPNLVEAVKDYMSFEQATRTNGTTARAAAIDASAKGPQAVAEAENALTGTLKSLFAVAENYPDLKANQNVMQLQEELTSTENKIAFARQFYNDSVLTYNNKIQMFPSNLIAGMFSFTTRQFFEVPEADKAVPTVDLR